jgi:integrase
MRKTLSDKGVEALKPRAKRYAFPDPELRGHYVRVQPSGAKSFVAVTLDPYGKQVWSTVGATDVLTIADAREKARTAIKRVREGLPAFEAPPMKPATFEDVAAQWLKRHVRGNKLRSEGEITRLLKVHVFPAWKDRAFLSIRRSDVAELLDEIEDDHGARQADCVLTITRSAMNWYAARHDDYVPPIVKGMRRTNPKERARARILDDGEISAVWAAANGTFGAFVKLLLLTAQRRAKVVGMCWPDISTDGMWTIRAEAREKGTGGELALPPMALEIIRALPHLGNNPHVLAAARGNGHLNNFGKAKRELDAKLPVDMPPWTLHDLRRTARSLLARVGVRPDIAERVLGHAQPGIVQLYDRHPYQLEKADALARLAALIAGIIDPRANVVPMARRKKSR